MSRATIDGRRARLDGRRPLGVLFESDGAARVRLRLPLPAGARAEGPVRLGREGATFQVGQGSQRFLIRPR